MNKKAKEIENNAKIDKSEIFQRGTLKTKEVPGICS
jgi:hypothetical protein